ncbi:MAG: hypothetical protein HKN42_06130 [Granulosicoccus sp.]|nr:hypothetical protein [Granulosicoccus sp.]
MDRKWLFGAMSVLLTLGACTENSALTVEENGADESGRGEMTLSLPLQLASTRALDLDSLFAVVTVNGDTERFEQGTTVTTSFSVPNGETLNLQVQWFESQQNDDPLLLTSWTRSQQVSDNISISISSEDYQSEGAAFDDDNDTYSNLEERREESDPRNANSTPINRPDVRIKWINPVEAPVIDGLYDSIWNSATFSDVTGEILAIDNLMINQGAVRPNGETEFIWFAMHDGINLYVFVFGENVENDPIRDSSSPWQDDNVNLFIDGNDSQGSSYDGVDDRHLFVPLLTSPEDQSANSTYYEIGVNSAPVPQLQFANCKCTSGRHTWEFKLPFADFNIQQDVPFGFEVQIDQDEDGGARDARWGWFHPARTTTDVDNTWTTPSFMGRVVVE